MSIHGKQWRDHLGVIKVESPTLRFNQPNQSEEGKGHEEEVPLIKDAVEEVKAPLIQDAVEEVP